MDELLAFRANEGSVWARQHLDACPVCRAELEALYQRVAQLKALPALGPARDRWPVIRDQVARTRVRARRRWAASGVAAAALIAGLAVFRPSGAGRAYADDLEQAKRLSASLEAELQRYDPDSRVVSGRAAALAAEIEDRIAAVDGRRVGSALHFEVKDELSRALGRFVHAGDVVLVKGSRGKAMEEVIESFRRLTAPAA
jgi:hypothetical protein